MTTIGILERAALALVPDFLRGPNAGRFLKSVALAIDGSIEAMRQGATFADPLRCPRECLPAISRDRGIPIWPTQPEATQRALLADWLRLHRLRGMHEGVLRMVQAYFIGGPVPAMRIVHQSGDGASCEWSELSATGVFETYRVTPSNWNFDAHSDRWARWWLIIDDMSGIYSVPALYAPRLWDGGEVWDSGAHWDGMWTQPALDILGMALAWKRAGTRLQGIIINHLSLSAPVLDHTSTLTVDPAGWTTIPSSNWGSPIDTATGLPNRPPYVEFIYEAG